MFNIGRTKRTTNGEPAFLLPISLLDGAFPQGDENARYQPLGMARLPHKQSEPIACLAPAIGLPMLTPRIEGLASFVLALILMWIETIVRIQHFVRTVGTGLFFVDLK